MNLRRESSLIIQVVLEREGKELYKMCFDSGKNVGIDRREKKKEKKKRELVDWFKQTVQRSLDCNGSNEPRLLSKVHIMVQLVS